MELRNFDANKAREIASAKKEAQLQGVLKKILEQAQDEKEVLHVYHTLSHDTVKSLEKRGFNVVAGNSLTIQKDGLYYSIYWAENQ
jgi:hypothetical protein